MVVMSQLKPTSVRFTGLLISKASAGSQRTCSRRETSVNDFWEAPILGLTDHEKKVM